MTVVMIVDDHHLIRTGVKNLLAREFPNMLVKGAAAMTEALALLAEDDRVDLVLLDINLPDAAGLDGLARLKQSHPATAVALISGTEDHPLIQAAIAQGADGFIPKSADPQVLLNAVSLILNGEIFLPRSFLKRGQQFPDSATIIGPKTALHDLTPRQRDVFGLMRQGHSNKEIARQLDLSESTVKTHVSAILKAFGATSRAKAIAKASDDAAPPHSLSSHSLGA